MKTKLTKTLVILLVVSSVSDSKPTSKYTMSEYTPEQGNKDPISVLRNIQQLESEAKQFQKEAHENKRNYSISDNIFYSVIHKHPLIKKGLDIYGESENMKIGCLVKFYNGVQYVIDEIRKDSVNFTCEDLEEFHEMLDSVLKDLVDSRILVEEELKNEIAESSIVCVQKPSKCDQVKEFVNKAEMGYVIIFSLKEVLPKLKEKCILNNMEGEKITTNIRKRLLEPIVQCIYPHKPELILELASNYMAT